MVLSAPDWRNRELAARASSGRSQRSLDRFHERRNGGAWMGMSGSNAADARANRFALALGLLGGVEPAIMMLADDPDRLIRIGDAHRNVEIARAGERHLAAEHGRARPL